MTDLEARLERLEDLAEINQLFIDYGTHLDAGRIPEYASLFATDGTIDLGPLGAATGRAEIQALMSRVLDGLVGNTFHLISSPVIQLDGDKATSEVMWTMIRRNDDGTPLLEMLGRHRDQLIREEGHWRIRSRKGYIDIPESYPMDD